MQDANYVQRAEKLARDIAAEKGCEMWEIWGRRRSKFLAQVRLHIQWRLYHETPLSLPEIGDVMRRDHSTICKNIRVMKERANASDTIPSV